MSLLPHMAALPAAAAAEATPVFTHDRALVGLSLVVATLTAYAFLEVLARARAYRGVPAVVWAGAGGTLLGAGIWATHFIGLLAFQSPLERGLAMAPAVGSALCALMGAKIAFMVAVPPPNPLRYGLGTAILTVGALAMHIWGLTGLLLDGAVAVRNVWAVVAAAGTVAAALAVVVVAPLLTERPWRLMGALPIAATVAGLHYLAMAALVITPAPQVARPDALSPFPIAWAIASGLTVLSAIAILVSILDERRKAREPLRDHEEHVVEIPITPATPDNVVVLSR